MAETLTAREGYVPFHGYQTWYRMVGDHDEPGKFPLLTLHGGPGLPHGYLEPLEGVATTGRRVVFYDQLGCGNSATPSNPSLWSVDLYVEEVEAIRQALGLEQVHILGHSWGGMLAMEYALTQPTGVVSLILSDTLASVPHWVAEIARLKKDLPLEIQQTLQQHEAAGTAESPEYQQAVGQFNRRHFNRLDPAPSCFSRAFQQMMDNPEVAATFFGLDEWSVTGTLKDWDITHRLGEIRAPTLVIVGQYGHVTPSLAETIHRGIRGAELVVFEHSAHFPFLVEPERYVQVLEDFLSRSELRA